MSASTRICERCRKELPAAVPNDVHEANRMALCAPCREKLLGHSHRGGGSQFRIARPQSDPKQPDSST